MADFDEMVELLEKTAKVNVAVTLPFIQRKTGLKVIDIGADHGQIVTEADKKVSLYLLDGGLQGVPGVRGKYPGSFSEEDDTPARLTATEIIQIDPIDGTGDFKDTYTFNKVVGPTTLISKLERVSAADKFVPVAGLIYDIINGTALISDGKDIGLYHVDKTGKITDVDYELIMPSDWKEGDIVRINRRYSYLQRNFDADFMGYLHKKGIAVQQILVGGAGIFAMQFFRNYIIAVDDLGKNFNDLETVTIGFACQPDWKTWDTNPAEVVHKALCDILSLPNRAIWTDIYGEQLKANAANATLKDMHHTKGVVFTTSDTLAQIMYDHAKNFEKETGKSLLVKDY